jgi:hypothetical protein
MDMADPNRWQLLKDKDEPKWRKSSTDRPDPKSDMPNKEKTLPSLATPRNDIVAPNSM